MSRILPKEIRQLYYFAVNKLSWDQMIFILLINCHAEYSVAGVWNLLLKIQRSQIQLEKILLNPPNMNLQLAKEHQTSLLCWMKFKHQ